MRTGLLTAGALLVMVGVAFLTAALWVALALQIGGPFASLIVGSAYLGLGLIVIGVAVSKPSQETAAPSEPEQEEPPLELDDAPPLLQALLQAFLYGMQTGMKAGK